MKLYKLTEQDNTTYNGSTLWGENITHKITIPGTKLCSNQVIHAYKNKYQAILMNPSHATIFNPKLWEAEGKIVANDGTKVGVKKLTTIQEIEPPKISTEQRIQFAIKCVKKVYYDPNWNIWADNWLNKIDRSKSAAYATANAANATANATANAAAYYAAYAAAYATANAANAAYDAAYAAAYAADAARINRHINIIIDVIEEMWEE